MSIQIPPRITPHDPIAALLLAVLGELRELRDAVRALEPSPRRPAPATLSRADRDQLVKLLPAIAGAFGSTTFAARELVNEAPAAVRVVTRRLNARRLGRLFQRAEGSPVDGYVVARVGTELGVLLWRVLAVPGNGKVSVPPRSAPDAV